MPQPTPPTPEPAAAPESAPLPKTPPAGTPKPAEESAIFHALLDAGVEARLAYTAEKKMHTMTSETVAAHTQPIQAEVRDLAAIVRDLTVKVRDLTVEVRDLTVEVRNLAKAGAERDHRLDMIVARIDGLKLLGQIMVGAYALLITVLIAVFSLLFTNAN